MTFFLLNPTWQELLYSDDKFKPSVTFDKTKEIILVTNKVIVINKYGTKRL
jgi:hypothetical protein